MLLALLGCWDPEHLEGKPCMMDRDCGGLRCSDEGICGATDPTPDNTSPGDADETTGNEDVNESATAVTDDLAEEDPVCGDGNVDREQCDDANLETGDGCESDCSISPGQIEWEWRSELPGSSGRAILPLDAGSGFVLVTQLDASQELRLTHHDTQGRLLSSRDLAIPGQRLRPTGIGRSGPDHVTVAGWREADTDQVFVDLFYLSTLSSVGGSRALLNTPSRALGLVSTETRSYIAGRQLDDEQWSPWIARFDRSGILEDERREDAAPGGRLSSLALSPGGQLVAAGLTTEEDGSVYGARLFAYNIDLQPLWTVELGRTSDASPSIAVNEAGVFTAIAPLVDDHPVAVLSHHDLEGEHQWTKYYWHQTVTRGVAVALGDREGPGLAQTLGNPDAEGQHLRAIGVDALGSPTWAVDYAPEMTTRVYDLKIDADGHLVVTGEISDSQGSHAFLLALGPPGP